jgi:hypothetical protein
LKKGKFHSFVCYEVNLAFVPRDTWWVDSSATIHISVSMQGCLWSRPSSDNERFIYVGDGNKVTVQAVRTFRLHLSTSFNLDLYETFVVPPFRRNLISISSLKQFGFSYLF